MFPLYDFVLNDEILFLEIKGKHSLNLYIFVHLRKLKPMNTVIVESWNIIVSNYDLLTYFVYPPIPCAYMFGIYYEMFRVNKELWIILISFENNSVQLKQEVNM